MSTHGGGSGSPGEPGQRTQLGLGAPKSTSQPSMPRIPVAAADSGSVARSVSGEASRPVAPSRPSSAPIIIGILVVVAAAMGAVYWFVLREPGADSHVVDTGTGSGSAVVNAGSGSAAVVVPAGSDSGSGSAVAAGSGSDVGSAAGSGSDVAMSGSNDAGSAAVVPAAPTVDTVITASAKGAIVEIVGTDLKGPSPFTAKLEKDKPYKARITAAGFTVTEIDVKGGARTTATLALKPRVVSVTTDPAGASIYIDNVDTGKVTPDSVTLSAAQASRPRVRISLRRSGFRSVDTTVEASAFTDEGGTMTNAVEAKLTVQQVVRPPPGGSTGTTGTDSGSAATGTGSSGAGGTGGGATGSGAGSATTGTGSAAPSPNAGSGSATKPTGSATPPPLSTGGGLPTELK
jgi:hypothetical protein